MSHEDLEHQFRSFKNEMGQRLQALEEEVAHLRTREDRPAEGAPPTKSTPVTLTEDDLIEGVECDIVLRAPPKAEFVVPIKIVAVEKGPVTLRLTDEEWKLYGGEDDTDE